MKRLKLRGKIIENGKRDIVLSSGTYNILTVQDDETGRFILKVCA